MVTVPVDVIRTNGKHFDNGIIIFKEVVDVTIRNVPPTSLGGNIVNGDVKEMKRIEP